MVAGVARVFGAVGGPAELRRLAASSAASLNRTARRLLLGCTNDSWWPSDARFFAHTRQRWLRCKKLLNRLIAKHTRSPADWRPAMAQRREGQPAYSDIIQAAIRDRAPPRHGCGAPENLAYVVLNG